MSYENMRQTTNQLNIIIMRSQDEKPDDNSDQYYHGIISQGDLTL